MIVFNAAALLTGCTPAPSASEDPLDTGSLTVTVETPVYRATWEADDADPVVVELGPERLAVLPVAGNCTPSLLVHGATTNHGSPDILSNLYFPGPLQADMVVALPPAEPDEQLTPLLITTKDPYDASVEGGPFPWPDGWDGCVTGASISGGTCPDPLPW